MAALDCTVLLHCIFSLLNVGQPFHDQCWAKGEDSAEWGNTDMYASGALQGRQIFLNLGHALKYDNRWAEEKGQLSPQQFYPERWLSEEGQKTGAFMPFGGGLRLCVGYLLAQFEMKVRPLQASCCLFWASQTLDRRTAACLCLCVQCLPQSCK